MTMLLTAVIISYVLHPYVNSLEKRGVKRALAITIMYLVVIAVFFVVIWFLLPWLISNFQHLLKRLPNLKNDLIEKIDSLAVHYRLDALPFNITETIQGKFIQLQENLIKSISNYLSIITGIFNFIVEFILGIVLAFYILVDLKLVKKNLKYLVPRKARKFVIEMLVDIDKVLNGYIKGQITVCLILATASTVALLSINVKYALLLGLFAGFSELIPYFGPIIGAVPAALIALADSPAKAITVLILFFVLQQIEGAFLSPKIVGDKLGIHPVVTIVLIAFAGNYFGIIGILFIIPVFAVIRVIFNKVITLFVVKD